MKNESSRFWPVAAALVIASVVYCLPLFNHLDNWGRQDWDQFTFRYATPRVALLRDHVLPTWNPYAAGGNVLLAHPDSPVLSPWYLIVLILNAPLGLRVQVLVFMALGAVGMAALTRRLGASSLGSMAGGIVFMMSSHFALHMTEGHLEWCVLGLMPWVALCLLQQTRRAIVLAAVLFASVLTFGSVYIPAIFLPFFSVWMFFEAVRRRRFDPLIRWAAFLVIALLLAAPKLLPVVAFTSSHPRVPILGVDAPASLWPTMFGDPRQAKFYEAYRDRELAPGHFAKVLTDDAAAPLVATLERAGLQFGFHEFGCYIGLAGIALALIGFWRTGRRFWPLYAAGAFAALIVLGSNAPINLWSWLQQLPLYHQLRVPSRFLMAIVFVLAIATAFGMTFVTGVDHARSRMRRVVALILIAGLYGELLSMGWTLFSDIFVVPAVAMEAHADFAQRCQGKPDGYEEVIDSAMYRCLLANSGDQDAYENATVDRGRVRLVTDPGYRGEVYLEHGPGTAVMSSWTMSRVRVETRAQGATPLILNQNFDVGWRATVRDSHGGAIAVAATRSPEGLVSVPVSADVTAVEFFYVAAGFTTGVMIAAPTLIGCVAFLAVTSRRRRRDGSAN